MPVYEYTCQACENTTEALRRMDDADQPLACEHCGHEKTHRTHSVFSAAAGQAGGGPDLAMPPAGSCGRCGDPAGSCGL